MVKTNSWLVPLPVPRDKQSFPRSIGGIGLTHNNKDVFRSTRIGRGLEDAVMRRGNQEIAYQCISLILVSTSIPYETPTRFRFERSGVLPK